MAGLLLFGLPLAARPAVKPYLNLPDHAEGAMPRLLSQTGAFADAAGLKASPGLVPYVLNVTFWSDGAAKSRWMALPDREKVHFTKTGEWTFPAGTVFVKHFELATDETRPEIRRRLETRLIVRDATGGVYGVTYKWRADNRDAELLETNLTETIAIKTASGTRTQSWYYPSRQDCLTCHTLLAGGVLGVKTRQLNCDFTRPDGGGTENQLRAWNRMGLFDEPLGDAAPAGCARLADARDRTRSLEERARSYLDANCSHCHRPGGTVAGFDARYDTPLAEQNLVGGRVLIDEGIDRARVIAPNDPWRSIACMRMSRLDGTKMPPLAHGETDRAGLALIREWIESLPGPPVLPPPRITPAGGNYHGAVSVELKCDTADAQIHYTLDGSAPTSSDPVYEKPLRLTGPTVLRTRAFKLGYTRSIAAQEVFIVNE